MLQPKTSFLSIFIISCVFVTISSGTYLYLKNQKEVEISTQLQKLHNQKRQAIEKWIDAKRTALTDSILNIDLEHILKALTVSHKDSTLQSQVRSQFSQAIVENNFLGYFLVSKSRFNLSSMRDSNVGVFSLLANDDPFFEAMDQGKVALSTLTISDVALPDEHGALKTGLPTAFVGKAIIDANNNTLGYILFRLNAYASLKTLIAHNDEDADSFNYFINLHKEIVIRNTEFPHHFQGSSYSPSLHTSDMTWSKYQNIWQEDVIGLSSKMPSLNISLVTEMGFEKAFGALHESFAIFVLGGGALYFSAVWFVFLHRRNEKTVRSQQHYLQTIIDHSADGIVVIDKNSLIRTVNPALATLCGYEQTELLGQHFNILLPEDLREFHPRLVKTSSIKSIKKISGNRELFAEHKSGQKIPVEVKVSPIKGAREMLFVGMVHDISDKLASNSNLNRFKSALDKSFDSIIMFEPDDLKIIYANQGIIRLTGLAEEELLKMKFQDLGLGLNKEALFNHLQPLRSGFEIREVFTWQIMSRVGKNVPTEISMQYIRSDGFPPLFIAFLRDVSRELETQYIIKKREKMLKSILETSVAHIALLDEEGRVFEVNKSWERFFSSNESVHLNSFIGMSYQNVFEKYHFTDTCAPNDESGSPQELNILQNILNGTIDNWEGLYLCQFEEKRYWFQVFCRKVTDVVGVGCVVMHFDVTDLIHSQEKLKLISDQAIKANEEKSRFLATMSHEIRTPMNAVIGMVDLLLLSSLTDEQRNMASTVRTSAYSLLNIINDILDLSKIESGSLTLETIEVSVQDVLESVGQVTWPQARQNGVELIIDPSFEGPSRIMADPTRLRQIVLNLTNNAIKFSKSEDALGKVTVQSYFKKGGETGWLLCIDVIDNGIGMNENEIKNAFHPFVQADGTITREYGGTGLGLSICNSLVSAMEGKIAIESEIGLGSTFQVRIPVKEGQEREENTNDYKDLSNEFYILKKTSSYNLDQLIHKLIHSRNAYIEYVETETEIAECLLDFTSKNILFPIVITDESTTELSKKIKAVAEESLPDFRVLKITNNPSAKKGLNGHATFIIGSHPLLPSEFLWACDVLNGQASPLEVLATKEAYQNALFDGIAPSPDEARQSNQLILVAEDHDINREMIQIQLNKLGYACEIVKNGKEALDQIINNKGYGLLLTDCHMPHMDGFTLTKEIRKLEIQQPERKRLPIIAITANALVGEADRCFSVGMDEYLSKPVELLKFKYVIQKWLTLKSPNASNSSSNIIINRDYLKKIMGTDDQSILDELLNHYSSIIEDDILALEDAFKSRDRDKLSQAAHAAKGAAYTAGALNFGQELGNLQNIVHHGDWNEVLTLMQAIRQQYQSIQSSFTGRSL